MRLAWVVLIAGCTGCGRVAFDDRDAGVALDASDASDASDAPPCIALGHDEDRDLIDDACDVCPHRPDPSQADRDGDRVGDACDPNPTTAGDRIVFFDSFVTARPEWGYAGAAQIYNGEQLVIDARTTGLLGEIDAVPTSDQFSYGIHLDGGGAGFRQLTLYLRTGPSAYYFAELYEDQGALQWKLTYTFDDMNYLNMAASAATGPLLAGDLILELTHAPRAVATTSWPAAMPTIAGDVPAGLTAPIGVGFVVQGLAVRIDWFVQIHTGS